MDLGRLRIPIRECVTDFGVVLLSPLVRLSRRSLETADRKLHIENLIIKRRLLLK